MSGPFVPLLVTATMRTPVAAARPIHLDGLLLAARLEAEGPSVFGLPLDCLAEEGGVPRASCSFVVASGPAGVVAGEQTAIRSLKVTSRDAALFRRDGPRREGLVSKSGRWRPQITVQPVLYGVGALAWHALGDPDLLEGDLEEVWWVGAMHGQGFGEVARWDVRPADLDPAEAGWFRRGRPVRRLPVATVEARLGAVPADLLRSNSRPVAPYWVADGATDCVEPRLGAMVVRASELAGLTGS